MHEIDQYIAQFPVPQQTMMEEMRRLIRTVAPEATEKIGWKMPTFIFKGNLVHFAMHKAHLGFYPGPAAVLHFESRLQGYKHSKGAIQFPLGSALPAPLIQDMVAFCLAKNRQRQK